MASREVKSFCRVCPALCGVRVSLDSDRRVTAVRPDADHAISRGYFCFKGMQAPALLNAPDRIIRPLKRMPDGSFAVIDLEVALAEIAERVARLRDASGADSIAAFRGTQNYLDSVGGPLLREFMRALGSNSYYSTMTIDQSAKWVAIERLGLWDAGKQPAATSDVQLLVGTNPLVSMSTFGFTNSDPVRSLKAAKARGMKLIVIDPRRSDTARYADVFLQIKPGEDVTVLAGLLHLILANNWHDTEFCAQYVDGVETLRKAIADYTPDYVAQRAGVEASVLHNAAELFARLSSRGIAASGTGPDMGPHSNLAEHLLECLNVVCGRFLRAGELVSNPGVQSALRPFTARVFPPQRSWEKSPRSQSGYGMLFGERMSAMLPADIQRPGNDRIRALFVAGGNPALAFPDPQLIVSALKTLDLLVTIDPVMTATARLSHYILPPKILFERADMPPRLYETAMFSRPFNQYSPGFAQPPADSQLVDDWYVFWRIAQINGWPLEFEGHPVDMTRTPDAETFLATLLHDAPIPFSEVQRHPGGKIFTIEPAQVQPPSPTDTGRFAVAPADVVEELAEVRNEIPATAPFRLAVRRMRDAINTMCHTVPAIRARHPFNPAYLNPDDIAALQISSGDRVHIRSAYGSITATVEADQSLRRGVVSITHGWGDAHLDGGVSPNPLIAVDSSVDPINAMPQMTAVPVDIEKIIH